MFSRTSDVLLVSSLRITRELESSVINTALEGFTLTTKSSISPSLLVFSSSKASVKLSPGLTGADGFKRLILITGCPVVSPPPPPLPPPYSSHSMMLAVTTSEGMPES